MLRLTPGDPAAVIAGDNATSDQINDIREKLGLNEPIWTQFAIWIGNILQGNFGESFFFKKTVAELIAQRIEPTLALATLHPDLRRLPSPCRSACSPPTARARCSTASSWPSAVLGFSVPGFVIGYCLIYVFAIELGWLPVQGYVRIGVNFWQFLERMILPSLTLSVGFIALISRITRASVLEVLNEDYIRTARAKGLSNRVVLMRHALRNAAVPILTVIGLGIAILIGGAVVTESVFGLPGLGRLTVEAVLSRDFPTIQTVILMFSVVYVRDQPADRHQLHPVRSEDPLLTVATEDVVDSASHRGGLDQAQEPVARLPCATPTSSSAAPSC